MFWDFVLIFVLIALNGFFVSVEFAAVAARYHRIDALAQQGSGAARIVRVWLSSPAERDRLIAATQLGITIVSLALGAVGEKAFESALAPLVHQTALPPALSFLQGILPSLPLLLSLTIVTSFHVVFGEQVPKVATLRSPETFALRAAYPMRLFETTFRWFVDILDWATHFTLRLLGIPEADATHGHLSVEELKHLVEETPPADLQPESSEMLSAVLDFGELLVRQVMVPHTDIIAVQAATPLPDVIRLFSRHAVTKFPVYGEDLDDIVGILHIKDVVRLWGSPEFEQRTAGDVAREALFVPETLPVIAVLRRFRETRRHIAIVVDEYGGTAGLVTLEDLLEEIVGEVSDPFDETTPEIQPRPDGTAIVDGRALLEEVNEALGLDLTTPYYDTIAGYILDKLGRIPAVGEVVEEDGVRLTVLAMDGLRVSRLKIERLPTDEAGEAKEAEEDAAQAA